MQYFDLQVNGYAGVDFNDDELSIDKLADVCVRLKSEGVVGILATVITAELPVMCQRIRNVRHAVDAVGEIADLVQGIHIEGPFLNEQPGYIGAHPAEAACVADLDMMKQLLEAAGELTRIVTLAPERDPGLHVTGYLRNQGITVSAGHCDATRDELLAAINEGLTMFTHLGNGCPLMMHRHDNIIQRVLSLADQLQIGLIADGIHVPWVALQNYLRCAGLERCFVVTDAISAAGMGPGEFQLGDQTVVVDDQLATWSSDRSHLTGSAATMPFVEENLRRHLELDDAAIKRLMYGNPRKAIGMS